MQKNKRVISNIFTIFFLILFLIYLDNNRGLIETLISISVINILFLLFLSICRLFSISYTNSYLYKKVDLDLSFLQSFNIVCINRLGNKIAPISAGSGYKLYYFTKIRKVKMTSYLVLNANYTVLTTLLNLLFVFVTIGFYLDFSYFLITLAICLIILILFSLILKTKFLNKFNFIKTLKTVSIKFYKADLNFFVIILSSLLTLFINVFFIFYVINVYSITANIYDVSLFYTIGQTVNIFSITPGNIGILETIQISLQNLYSFNTSEILLITLLSRAIDYIVTAITYMFSGSMVKKLNT